MPVKFRTTPGLEEVFVHLAKKLLEAEENKAGQRNGTRQPMTGATAVDQQGPSRLGEL